MEQRSDEGVEAPQPWCRCSRCQEQLYVGSCGTFRFDPQTCVWVATCLKCLLPEED